ncbi:MAG: hypothetical protein ACREOO_26890 [bacterium]
MSKKYKILLPRDPESRRIIREALAGYRRMNEFTEEELRRELPKMTEDDSRKIFEELYAAWQQTRQYYPDPKGDAILDQQHIQELVEQRRLWNKIGWELAKRG